MVTILIEMRRLLEGKHLLEEALISMWAHKKVVVIRRWHLLEAGRLLKEIRQTQVIRERKVQLVT